MSHQFLGCLQWVLSIFYRKIVLHFKIFIKCCVINFIHNSEGGLGVAIVRLSTTRVWCGILAVHFNKIWPLKTVWTVGMRHYTPVVPNLTIGTPSPPSEFWLKRIMQHLINILKCHCATDPRSPTRHSLLIFLVFYFCCHVGWSWLKLTLKYSCGSEDVLTFTGHYQRAHWTWSSTLTCRPRIHTSAIHVSTLALEPCYDTVSNDIYNSKPI